MSFFPEGFNPRDDVAAVFTLVSIDTPDGVMRFMPGYEGIFTDTSGNEWTGSVMLGVSELEPSIQGTAPGGQASISYFQDPDAPDLIAQVQELGVDYIRGRDITIYIQPFTALEHMYAPVIPPILLFTRTMTTLQTQVQGPETRRLSVSFEGPFEARRQARRLLYNVADHSRLVGSDNQSLAYMPTVDFQEELLFG